MLSSLISYITYSQIWIVQHKKQIYIGGRLLPPPHFQVCPVRVVLYWSVSHHDASIRDIPPEVGWDIFIVNEENCISAFNLSRHALSEAPEFVAV